MPRLDGDTVFYALVDSADCTGPGRTRNGEIEGIARSEQRYNHATAILRTQPFDANGMGIEATDFAPRFWQRDRVFRPAQLVRRVRPLVGRSRVRFGARPSSQRGAVKPAKRKMNLSVSADTADVLYGGGHAPYGPSSGFP